MKRLIEWWSGPRSSLQIHRVFSIFWVIMAFPTVLYWNSSVPYLVFISVYAVIGFHVMALKESKIEAKEDEEPRFRYRRKK